MRKQVSRGIVGLGLVLTGSLLSGCVKEDVDSDAIRTKGMYADYSALAVGNGDTVVTAQLTVGGDNGTIVKLVDEDELEATVGDETKRLGAINNRERYRGTFSTDDGGTEITISFLRGDEDENAPDSFATLPDKFDLSIDGDTEIQRGTAVDISWDPEGSGSVSWSVEGDCVWSESGSTNDDGAATIAAEDIRVQNLDKGETCDVTVTVDRVSTGTVDPEFEEGGRFRAIQRRTATFTSTPNPDEFEDTGDGG